jgi:hypothetical protein
MDFATLSQLVQSSGYTKASTQSSLIKYDTLFTRGSDKISIQWELGGYVRSVAVGDASGIVARYECANSFITSFSEN